MFRTPICDLLGLDYPIIQGGMAWLGTYELASAVSNAGGLGIIGCGNSDSLWVRNQIRETRSRTTRPFGVNVMLISPHTDEVIQTILEERVPVVCFGAGNPGKYIKHFKEAGIKIIPVVSSVALAKRLERDGADAIVAEGMESGGHIGETTTMVLVPQVVDAVHIPVVAAGGIADGRGLIAALSLGAQGIQMGTRFICSDECIAHPKFKEKITEARDRSTIVTGETLGHPVRCLENKMTRQFKAMEKAGASKEELEKFGTGKYYQGVIQGDLEWGSLLSGQIAGMVSDIKPVKEIIEDVIFEAELAVRNLLKMTKEVSFA